MFYFKNSPFFTFLVGIVFLTMVAACSNSKRVHTTHKSDAADANVSNAAAKYKMVQKLQKSIDAALFDANTFTTKAKLKFTQNGKSELPVNITLRLQKDKAIWLSVAPALGFLSIEVARALITPDSIKVLDKINSRYYAKEFCYINNYVHYPLDFATLQSLLLGQYVRYEDFSEVHSNAAVERLLSQNSVLSAQRDNYRVQSMEITDTAQARYLLAQYHDYILLDNQKAFSTKRRYVMKNQGDHYEVEIECSNPQANTALKMPFEVSDGYERVK